MFELAAFLGVVALVIALVALKRISQLQSAMIDLQLRLTAQAEEVARLMNLRAAAEPAAELPPVLAEPSMLAGEEAEAEPEPVHEKPAEEVPPPPGKWISAAEEEAAPVLTEVAVEPPPVDLPSPEPAPSTEAEAEEALPTPTPPPRDMEQALASRWFVWIGGVAIAVGGILFVKYAYDNNLIPPALQIVLGLVIAALLVAAGEHVRRKSADIAGPNYVPAALSASGLVTAFGSIYAAYALYELIAPTPAFLGLAAVGLGALALSRLQGPLIAALGLIGSYVTPTLIPSEHPSAWNFFPYLLVIHAASFAVLRGRSWWWLGYAAIAGSTGWALLWLVGRPFEPQDIWPIGLFAHAVGLISFFAIAGPGILRDDEGASLSPPLMIGLAGLAVEALIVGTLVRQADHAPVAMALFMLAMGEMLLIGWKKRAIQFLAPAGAVFTLLVLVSWNEVAFHELAMDENGIWSSVAGPAAGEYLRWMLGAAVLFTLAGCLGSRLKPQPILWGGLGGASAFLFAFGAWARADALLSVTVWVVIAAAFAAALLATVMAGKAKHGEAPALDLASGLLSSGSALLLLFAADRLFDQIWFTLAIAGLALAFAALAGVMRVTLQASIAGAFGTLVTVRLFVSRHLWLDDRGLPWGRHWLLYGYGIPVILFLVASRLLKRAGYLRAAMSLEGLSLGLFISLVSLEIRVLIAGGVSAAEPGLLEMSAHILTWLGAAYGLLYRQRIYSSLIASWGARLLLGLSVLAILGLSLIKLNPVVAHDPLQGGVFFNALLLAYLAPAVLLWLIARRLASIDLGRFRSAVETLAVALVAVYLSLALKRLYGGPNLFVEAKDEVEAALHVLIWLGLAALLVYRGGFLTAEAVRWAGRGLAALAVLAIVFGGLGLHNPVLTGDPLSGNVAMNALLLVFVAPIGLIALISRRLERLEWAKLRPAAGVLSLVLAFAYLTLETKRVFQGPMMVPESLSIAESYAYSAVWLAFALALFIAGLRLSLQYVRYAGLGVMVVVVVKVFLLDMSNLEGLYRIASFIGLGLCLVGIGWLYQRFVQRSNATPE